MARRQAPLTGDGPLVRLALRLRGTRESAGLTLRQLSAVSGYSHSTLSLAESGRRLPSWEVVEAFVQSCGEADLSLWRAHWYRAGQEGREEEQGEPANDVPEGPATPSGRTHRGPSWWQCGVACLLSAAVAAGVVLQLRPAPARTVSPVLAAFPPGGRPTPTEACGGTVAGFGCHKKDPDATHCWEGAELVAASTFNHEGQVAGKLENWYSPRCGTSWAQLRMPKGWQGRVEITTQTGGRDCFPIDCQGFYDQQPPLWSNMLVGVNQPTLAKGYVKFPGGEVKAFEAATAEG
ncbi:helix-turn-helix domain-containing protein [Kitasatospora sp. NPDC051853]|uniref:helix-turn-helix domain-containing protein n=1 Tax=Kitasatospora sp. NPDC051853 TaxID=3364058 RepID=UPI0037BDCFF2